MLGILCLILGLSIFAMEIIHIAAFRMYLSLLFSFFGRGLFYVIIGCLTLENTSRQAELGIGLEIVIVGVLFIGMSFQGAPFDDPADECASVIHNIQHGLYVDGPSALEKGKWGGSVDASGKTVRTMGAYSGQGISNQTYQGASTSAATSIAPGGSTGGYTSSMASASASAAATAATHGFTAEKLPISHTQASSH
ncbi:hypothetical protein GGI07_001012 [Coemansia sp. Benny D115]|nr:hypothetical protein GGI07_001012 [Coemansia sp. Benny D115]